MATKLPRFSELIFPSFLSLAKGVNVNAAGIHSSLRFNNIMVDAADIKQFAAYIGISNPTPLVYIYILAQRAQAALMLQKEFTIAIPGLVHIANRLQQHAVIDYSAPFDIVAKVDVEPKAEGSLIPIFSVDFTQNGLLVAQCYSTYLVKRKSNKPKAIAEIINPITKPFLEEVLDIPANAGRRYAKVSGDRNPIHTMPLFAKIMGFKRPIAHGWYLVAKIVNRCEMEKAAVFKTINVEFKAPVFLPGTPVLQLEDSANGGILFSLTSQADGKLVLTGSLR
jgi:MaoC like domain